MDEERSGTFLAEHCNISWTAKQGQLTEAVAGERAADLTVIDVLLLLLLIVVMSSD